MRRHRGVPLALGLAVAGLFAAGLPTAAAAAPAGRGTDWSGGPDLLRAPATTSSTLSASGPFRAPPVLVSGTTVIRSGELLSTDFLYDDRGPDTTPVPLAPPLRPDDRTSPLTPGTGDLVYPTAARHASNSADLVQLRMAVDGSDLVVRAALNTLEQAGTAALAVGFDLDRDDAVADWGHGLGELGPTGVDTVLWSDGVQARVGDVAVPTTTDVGKHHITTRVPLTLLRVATGTAEVFAVVGLSDGAAGFRGAAAQPSQDTPGGDPLGSAPPVFNVAFRDMEQEPFGSVSEPGAVGTRGASYGQWREHAQAKALAARDLSTFSAELPWALLRSGGNAGTVPTTGYLNRILVSSRTFGAGVRADFPQYLGQLQPYAVFVPEDLPAEAPLLLWMHSSSSAHNQYASTSPDVYQDLGRDTGSVVLTPLGRGADGDWVGPGELDVLEAVADIGRHVPLDTSRVRLGGYSQGGYGTFRLGALWPELFAAGFNVVGRAGDRRDNGAYTCSTTEPHRQTARYFDNLRHLPLLIWHGTADQLSPAHCTLQDVSRLDQLGYRYEQDYLAADHLVLTRIDEWQRGGDFLAAARRQAQPSRVTYRRVPATDAAALGLVHDRAWWLSGITLPRDADEDATGLVDAVSLARPDAEPVVERFSTQGVDPLPYVGRGVRWTGHEPSTPSNGLEVRLDGVTAVTVDVEGAGVGLERPLEVAVSTAGAAVLRLAGADIAPGLTVEVVRGRVTSKVRRGVAELAVDGDALVRLVRPTSAAVSGSTGGAPAAVLPAARSLPATGPTTELPLAAVLLLLPAAAVHRHRRRASPPRP